MCLKYGFLPIIFFFKGKNFYKEREKWVKENKSVNVKT
jgi:hypothetical protein